MTNVFQRGFLIAAAAAASLATTAHAATVFPVFDPVDSTDEIKAAIDQAGPGGTVILTPQSGPWNVREKFGAPNFKTAIRLNKANQTFRIEPGAQLRARRGYFKGDKATLIRINANGVTLEGGGFDSVIRMWKLDYQGPNYTESQFRHAIDVGGFNDVTIRNLTINYAGGDGINIGGFFSANRVPKRLNISNMNIYEAHRNGISLSSAKDSVIDNVGVWNTRGHDPEAGIDVEIDHTYQRVQNVTVKNSTFGFSERTNIDVVLFNYHNNSLDQGIPTDWMSVHFENCRSVGSLNRGIRVIGPSGPDFDQPTGVPGNTWISFDNCKSEDTAGNGLQLGHIYDDTGTFVWFDKLLVKNSGRVDSSASPIRFLWGKPGYTTGNVGFYSSSRVVDDRDVTTISAPAWMHPYGFSNIAGSLRVDNSAGLPSMDLGQMLFNVTLTLF